MFSLCDGGIISGFGDWLLKEVPDAVSRRELTARPASPCHIAVRNL